MYKCEYDLSIYYQVLNDKVVWLYGKTNKDNIINNILISF